MKAACKNTNCKHYYNLNGTHCAAESECAQYSTNRKRSDKQRVKCKECEYVKRKIDVIGVSYHYECAHPNNDKPKLILFIDDRQCDMKMPRG